MHRIVFISLEFSAGTFSGNGVYARSQVRSLCQQSCDLLVLSGKPVGFSAPPQTEGALQLIQVELPAWNRLDRGCGWAELAEQAGSPAVVKQVTAFCPSAILGVDWSSLPTYKALAAAFKSSGLPVPPYIYMNYRVYLRTCLPADEDFMQQMESEAAATAAQVVALSRSDADFITKHLLPKHSAVPVMVLLPALRSDLASIPLPSDSLQPASPAPLTDQCMDSHPMALTSHHLRRTGHSTAATTAPPAVHKHGRPGNQASSQQSSAVSTCFRLGAEAAESTSASRPPATPDNVPILPLNTQTAMGSCVSPKVGRRTTPFSTSEPSHQSVPESRQDTAATAAVLQHDSLMQDATVASTFVGDVQESSVDSQQDTAMQAASNATADECHGSCGEPEERSDGCRHRSYLTCCVRLSVEKEPHRFVELVEELERQGSLHRLGIVPLMCACGTSPYAMDLVARLQAAAPSAVIHRHFLGPHQLAEIYRQTQLNIHPCLYDAYGMTVVEAASQGAPSLVNGGGAVGASDLLKAPSEILETDMSVPVPRLAQQVAELWQSPVRLTELGQAAAVKARCWTESANAATLLSLVEQVMRTE